ncbi:MAG: response regulator [Thermoanaerobaculia bacterium]
MSEDLTSREVEPPASRVLVVIGESASRSFVVRILESVLLEVDSASRYEEALEKLDQDYRPAALIIDPTIPRVDGVELIRKIHAERPDLLNRTIVIAEPSSPLSEQIRRESPCRQIQRPVLRHELIEAVSECLREPQS